MYSTDILLLRRWMLSIAAIALYGRMPNSAVACVLEVSNSVYLVSLISVFWYSRFSFESIVVLFFFIDK